MTIENQPEEEKLLHKRDPQRAAQINIDQRLSEDLYTKIFSFISPIDFFSVIRGFPKALYQSMLQKNRLHAILGPLSDSHYKAADLFLKTQSQLHAPLGILGRDQKLIQQFLFEGRTDAFDSVMKSLLLIDDAEQKSEDPITLLKHKLEWSIEHPNAHPDDAFYDGKRRRYRYLSNAAPIKFLGFNIRTDTNKGYDDLDKDNHLDPEFKTKYRLQINGNLNTTQKTLNLAFYPTLCVLLIAAIALIAGANCLKEGPFRDNSSPECKAAGGSLFSMLLLILVKYCLVGSIHLRELWVDIKRGFDDVDKATKLLTTLGTFAVPQKKIADNTVIEVGPEEEKVALGR